MGDVDLAQGSPEPARRGRRSLSGAPRRSPKVDFRVTDTTAAALDRVARETGKTRSQIGREALERYLAHRAPGIAG